MKATQQLDMKDWVHEMAVFRKGRQPPIVCADRWPGDRGIARTAMGIFLRDKA
jgi:hypothetical protein